MTDRAGEALLEVGGTGNEQLDFLLRYPQREGVVQQIPGQLKNADQLWMLGIVSNEENPQALSVNYAVLGDGLANSRQLRRQVVSAYSQGQAYFTAALEAVVFGDDRSKEESWRDFEVDILRNAAINLAEFEGRFIGGYLVSHDRASNTIVGGVAISSMLYKSYINALRSGGFQTPEEHREVATTEEIEEMRKLSIKTDEQRLKVGLQIGGIIARTLPLRRGLRDVLRRRRSATGWRAGTIWD